MNGTDLLVAAGLWVWNTTLAASPLAVLLLGLSVWPRVSAKVRAVVAALFFVRLMIPAVPVTDWHPVRLPTAVPPEAQEYRALPPSIPFAAELRAGAQAGFSAEAVLSAVWAIGAAVTLAWIAFSHLQLRRKIARSRCGLSAVVIAEFDRASRRAALARPPELVGVTFLSTMAVSGWLRPKLLVPAGIESRFTAAQLHGIFLHELAHVRRHDILATWVALVACAIHWFNPLAWLAFRRFAADREILCDAAALALLGAGERRSYGEALLLSLESPAFTPALALAPFFHFHPALKNRITMIAHPPAPTLSSILLAGILVPAVALLAFTTARADDEKETAKPATPPEKAAAGANKSAAPRDGEVAKSGARDGDTPRRGPRDGEGKPRGPREGDAAAVKAGARDGDAAGKKAGPREGGQPRAGVRDGEVKREGLRDGDQPRTGPRDGEKKNAGPRDGDSPRKGPREGDRAKPAEGQPATQD